MTQVTVSKSQGLTVRKIQGLTLGGQTVALHRAFRGRRKTRGDPEPRLVIKLAAAVAQWPAGVRS